MKSKIKYFLLGAFCIAFCFLVINNVKDIVTEKYTLTRYEYIDLQLGHLQNVLNIEGLACKLTCVISLEWYKKKIVVVKIFSSDNVKVANYKAFKADIKKLIIPILEEHELSQTYKIEFID